MAKVKTVSSRLFNQTFLNAPPKGRGRGDKTSKTRGEVEG